MCDHCAAEALPEAEDEIVRLRRFLTTTQDMLGDARAELAELPERIAAKIEQNKGQGATEIVEIAFGRAAAIARSFAPASNPEVTT